MLSFNSLLESIPTTTLPPPIPLTKSSSSWIIHYPKFFPSRTQGFRSIFQNHPKEYHPLFMFGKRTYENRYSQLFVTDASVGDSYHYSGTSRKCVTCDPSLEDQQLVLDLCRVADQLVTQLMDKNLVKRPSGLSSQSFYNCCLVNWYNPEHSIGLHSDDEKEMNLEVPILSLSWGGTRRFLLRPKPKAANEAINKVHEVLLKDGDLLIMGGKCQEEFKHEVPKVRKKDGLVGDRISWTIRSMNRGIKRKR